MKTVFKIADFLGLSNVYHINGVNILRLSAAIGAFILNVSGTVLAQERGLYPQLRAVFEKVYVPAYSHVLTTKGLRQPLASTMVVHNVDPKITISITSVDYFDSDGKKLKSFFNEPITLGPMAAQHFLVPINENKGGFGANYLVEWMSREPTLPPEIEAVMIGGSGTLGISFTSTGRVIDRR